MNEMTQKHIFTTEEIRQNHGDKLNLRDRDFCDALNISEAKLAAAYCGPLAKSKLETTKALRISTHPDQVIEAAVTSGEVMALTRNISCVHEKTGRFENYHSGVHAAMVLGKDIDLRIFPSQWWHGFILEKPTENGLRRSMQIFDAAGDAVHKISLKEASDLSAWDTACRALSADDQSPNIALTARRATEAPRINSEKIDILRAEWTPMTDTHQFLRLTSKLKMNRLGAYRCVGRPFARPLTPKTSMKCWN